MQKNDEKMATYTVKRTPVCSHLHCAGQFIAPSTSPHKEPLCEAIHRLECPLRIHFL